jgi:hypothetical protein
MIVTSRGGIPASQFREKFCAKNVQWENCVTAYVLHVKAAVVNRNSFPDSVTAYVFHGKTTDILGESGTHDLGNQICDNYVVLS